MKHKDGSTDKYKDKHKEKKVNYHAHNSLKKIHMVVHVILLPLLNLLNWSLNGVDVEGNWCAIDRFLVTPIKMLCKGFSVCDIHHSGPTSYVYVEKYKKVKYKT